MLDMARGEVVNFADRRIRPRAFAKVEVLDPLSLPVNTSKGAAVRRAASQMTGSRSSRPARAQARLCSASWRAGAVSTSVGTRRGEIKRRLFPEGGEVDQPLLTLNRCQGQLGGVMQQGWPRGHLLLQPGWRMG